MLYSADEKKILSKYFTNLSSNVFAVINLPEVIKGTLFSRYSRSSKDVRKLFLDEFIQNDQVKDMIKTDKKTDSELNVKRAEDFYDRIL
ncbi:MAG: thymidylate synthase, partial [bacterium]